MLVKVLNVGIVAWISLVSIGCVTCGCGARVTVDGQCEDGGAGAGGVPATGGASGGGSAGSAIVAECAIDKDCASVANPECGASRCVDGHCREEAFTSEYTCGSPDPDGQGPWIPAPGEFHCFGGQCCFTCIVDNGWSLGDFDESDGPCVAGNTDEFCGFGGGLCVNCKATGGACLNGQCVNVD